MAAPLNNNGNHQPEFLFRKRLSSTDTTTRLAWPSKYLDALIEATGHAGINLNATPGYGVPFQVSDQNNQVWHLICFTRQTGPYLKPVVSGEWVQFVQANNLHVGDRVLFYRNRDPASPAHFLVHFVRAP